MIEKYDVTIDNDGDGATLEGTITIGGNEHHLSMDGSGRDMEIELDGKPCPEAEKLSEWLAPVDAVQPILDETSDDEIEDWSGRIVDDKVVRLIVRDGRELRVVRGTLVDE